MDIKVDSNNITEQDILKKIEALCTQEDPPPCTAMCPMHLDVRKMHRLISEGDISGAYKLYKKTIPFAPVVSYICDAPCKTKCTRNEFGGAIETRAVEQWLFETPEKKEPMERSIKRPPKPQVIGIIGGDFRGMTAAAFLAEKGFSVTLYEKTDKLGGWVRSSSVPDNVLEHEIQQFEELNINIKYSTEVTEDELKRAGNYDQIIDFSLQTERRSIINDIREGRSTAISADRNIQKVNVDAGRDDEGDIETNLFVDLDGISTDATTPISNNGYDRDNAIKESKRCIKCECMQCVKKCGFMQHYGSYPKKYIREVYNNLSITMGVHNANEMIDNCMLCSQCGSICPNGLDMADVFQAARDKMVKTEKMPQSAFEFAILDMDYSLSDNFYLFRDRIDADSEYIFFPGCQLPASEPELTGNIYEDILNMTNNKTGIWLSCCGIMSKWAGQNEKFEAVAKRLYDEWAGGAGRKKLICACPTCEKTLSQIGIDTLSIYSFLEDKSPKAYGNKQKMILHDACGARYNDDIKESVRNISTNAGLDIHEGYKVSDRSPCCGYGGLLSYRDGDLINDVTDVAVRQMDNYVKNDINSFDTNILTYCVNCRDLFLKKGQTAYHLLEILYPTDEIRRRDPLWSERQDNRNGLKTKLLNSIFNEEIESVERMSLVMDDTVEKRLDEKHILGRDIESIINTSKDTKEYVKDNKTGHFLAEKRIKNVTFWVEYALEDDNIRIFDAWSYRMEGNVLAESEDKSTQYDDDSDYDFVCVKTNEKLTKQRVNMKYMNAAFPVSLYACASCGIIYVPRSLADGKILEVEKALEDK